MIKGRINHLSGIVLLIIVMCFLYYKSVVNETPLSNALNSIETIENLQVQLHRDLLRYRNNQIQQYDSLNYTLNELKQHINNLLSNNNIRSDINEKVYNTLKTSIKNQEKLVEDFKTHLSILKNSLSYLYNASNTIYSENNLYKETPTDNTAAELITLLLEYSENPEKSVANMIYPLIDKLNHNPDTDTNSLIIHSLLIIERIPEIDKILSVFNTLKVEKQIIAIKKIIIQKQHDQNRNSQIFNSLLFIFSLYLAIYIIYIVIKLQKSKRHLSSINNKLNHEVEHRIRTEKSLYKLVEMDNISNEDNEIKNLLNAICKSLDVCCAYICLVDKSRKNAKIIDLVCHENYTRNIPFKLSGTPCEDVINNEKVIHNHNVSNYYPNWDFNFLADRESYIGVSLNDKNRNIYGLLAVVHNKPVKDIILAERILSLATSRAIIELHKQIEYNNTQRYQYGLELIDEWIAKLITESSNEQLFYETICIAAREITKSQLAAFPVISYENNQYHLIATSGYKSELLDNFCSSLNDTEIYTTTVKSNKTLLINDVMTDPEIKDQFSKELNISSILLSPVTLKGKLYGAVSVFRSNQDFDKIDEQLISQFSQSVQMAIINMQLVDAIKSERERAEVTLHSIGDAVITTNIKGEIEYMNLAAETLTAWDFETVKNIAVQNVFRILDSDTHEAIHDIVKSCLDDGISINKSKLILQTKNNNEKDIESSISPILNTSGSIEGIIIVFHDETQRSQLEKTIKYQAAHDPLTDLLNRAAFDQELDMHVFDAKGNHKNHVLCYLDLDRFKLVNDTAGHSAGDQCLIEIASMIQSSIRNDDIFGRLGGDEFGLILKHCNIDAATRITNNIINTIKSFQFKWEGCDYNLGVSIGIVPLNQCTENTAEAVRKADLACYTAKDQGRGQVYVYEEQDCELIKRQKETYWASRVTEALDNNRIKLYAQPIVPLNKNLPQTKHFEILVRLLDTNNQLIQPDAFIPAAERYNLMYKIDKRIILDTFRFINSNKLLHSNAHYSINLSGNSLSENDTSAYIKSLLEKYTITPGNICFEITETAAIKDLQNAKRLINQLKEIGCQFALDDFGSGLSSFQYLKNLPVDYLKIDGSFVRDMVDNTIDQAMVAAINEVGHVMGIKTIAEYVENDQIIKKLQELNVDYGQGYGIAKPQPLISFFTETELEIDSAPTLKLVKNKS